MGGDGVHVPLDDDDLIFSPDGLLSQVESKEERALVEDHRLGRVEILRHRVAERAAAEADHATLARSNGEEQAIAESVAVAAALSLAEKPGLRRQRGIDSALIQVAASASPSGAKPRPNRSAISAETPRCASTSRPAAPGPVLRKTLA